MFACHSSPVASTLANAAVPLENIDGSAADDVETLDPIIDAIGNARLVLLGEATHGTAEFYAIREALTLRLIEAEGFAAAVIEADWPDAYRANRYIREAVVVSGKSPVLVDSYLSGAVEVDVDALCDGETVHVAGVMEHIEEAGVHSGDSACSLPPYTLSHK